MFIQNLKIIYRLKFENSSKEILQVSVGEKINNEFKLNIIMQDKKYCCT